MKYGPGFGLPGLMSPTPEVRQAIADLEALPSDPLRDGQLSMLRGKLEHHLKRYGPQGGAGGFDPPSEP